MPARTDSTSTRASYARAPRTSYVTVVALHDSSSDSSDDLSDNDGYELSAFGDISLSEAYQTPPPSAKTDRRNSRLRLKTDRPPMPRRRSSSNANILGTISPTCSGFRFPNLPTPTSPDSEKKQFQALVDAIKQRDRKREAEATRRAHNAAARLPPPSPPRFSQTAPRTPERRPTLRLDTANVRNTGIAASKAAGQSPHPTPVRGRTKARTQDKLPRREMAVPRWGEACCA